MTNKYQKQVKEAQHFAVSAGASAIGATAVYPIDLIKTRLQNQRKKLPSVQGSAVANESQIYKGTWDCFKKIIKNEGPIRLYSGLIPNLLGQVPEKAIRLFVVEQMRSFTATRLEKNQVKFGKKSKQLISEISAGMAAGTCQVFITNPTEVIKVRMQVFNSSAVNKPTVFSILRELGPKGLYRGASACFLRDIPFSGIYFPLYFLSKDFLSVSGPSSALSSSASFRLFFSASIAGMVAAGATTPADVIKTRLQAQKHYRGLWHCFSEIVKTEGYLTLYQGMVPRIMRSSPQYGVMLFAYEILQNLILSHPGVEIINSTSSAIVEDRWKIMSHWQPPVSFHNGIIKKISIGGMGNVWGLDKGGSVFKWTGFNWKSLESERLDYISVGADGAVCGVKDSSAVRLNPWNMEFYPLADSPELRVISVGHAAKIWGVGTNGYPYKYRIDGRWKPRGTRKIYKLSVGADGGVWAIEEGTNSILQWQSAANDWKVMATPEGASKPKLVSTASKTRVMIIDSSHKAWSYVQTSEDEGNWTVTNGSADQYSTLIKLDQDITKILFEKYDKILGG